MNLQNEPDKQDTLVAAIQELVKKVEQLNQPKIDAEDILWGHAEIGDYLKLTPEVVLRYVVTRPEFPQALQPCPTGKRAAKRWFAGEVIRWAKQNKGTLPKSRTRTTQSRREATSDAVAL